jgi:hypothetical protein
MLPTKNLEKHQISLDNALRHLYHAIRFCGGEIVAIRFTYLGERYEADTPEEATRLREQLRKADRALAKRDWRLAGKLAEAETGWNEEKFWSVINGIGKEQTKMLIALYHGGKLEAGQLAKALRLKSQVALGGVLSGLSKQLQAVKLKTTDIFIVETYWKGRKKTRWLRLTDGFETFAKTRLWKLHYLVEKEVEEIERAVNDFTRQTDNFTEP